MAKLERYTGAMWKLATCRVVVGLATVCALAQEPASELVEVKGTVVNSVTGQPISGASVLLTAGIVITKPMIEALSRSAQQNLEHLKSGNLERVQVPPGLQKPRDEFVTLTDEAGKFSFSGALGVAWSLGVSHRNYRAPNSDQDIAHFRDIGQSKPDSLTIKLDPLAVIEGKVTNEDGEPVPHMPVELFKIEIKDGRRTSRRHDARNTDDQGAYRLWSLSPGAYYLKVSGTPAASQSGVDYGPVYYPSSPDMEGAKMIRLAPGETLHADFSVTGRTAYRVKGTFLTPIADRRISVRLLRGDDETTNHFNVATSTNSFDTRDVTPGVYTLQAYAFAPRGTLFGETQITVGDADLSGVSIDLLPPISVSGTADPPHQEGSLQLTATHSNPRRLPPGLMPTSKASINQEGKFSLDNLWPGHYDFEVRRNGFPKAYIRSFTAGSIDLLAIGLTITSGAPEPIKIQLSEGAAAINAKLAEIVPDAEMVFVALQPKSGAAGQLTIVQISASVVIDTRKLNSQMSELLTKYVPSTFAGLAPGDYAIYAWRDSQQIEYKNPAVLAALSTHAVTVSVGSGETKEVTLKLIPKEDSQ